MATPQQHIDSGFGPRSSATEVVHGVDLTWAVSAELTGVDAFAAA